MQSELKTARLTLRPLAATDAADVIAGIGDIAVSGWLSVVPHPYGPADYQTFLNEYAVVGETYAVCDASGLAGVMGIEDATLGYWLAPDRQGQGYATEAARCLVDAWFAESTAPIRSGYFSGNDRSARVLGKLGFVEIGRDRRNCRALQTERDHVVMELTFQHWTAQGNGEASDV
jgi:RimJ/RimL family protein N-acetyltransferase